MNQPDPTPPPSTPPAPGATSTGLAPNVAGALAYLVGPITGVIFLVLEKQSSFVRFHAAQSIGLFIAFFILSIGLFIVSSVIAVIPVLGWILSFLISMAMFFGGLLLWIFLMYKAWSHEEWEFPWVGEQSRRVLLGDQGA